VSLLSAGVVALLPEIETVTVLHLLSARVVASGSPARRFPAGRFPAGRFPAGRHPPSACPRQLPHVEQPKVAGMSG